MSVVVADRALESTSIVVNIFGRYRLPARRFLVLLSPRTKYYMRKVSAIALDARGFLLYPPRCCLLLIDDAEDAIPEQLSESQ